MALMGVIDYIWWVEDGTSHRKKPSCHSNSACVVLTLQPVRRMLVWLGRQCLPRDVHHRALKAVLDEADSKAARQSGASAGGAAVVDHVAVRRKAAEQADNGGVFWIDFDSIFKYFTNMFLNWNPGLFSCR